MSILIDSLGRPVFLSGGSLVRPPSGGGGGVSGKTLLTQSDFTYLGYHQINLGADFSLGAGLALRYVSGSPRFLMGGDGAIKEVAVPGSYGTTITTTTNSWGLSNFAATNLTGKYFGIWWDDDNGALWLVACADYPSDPELNNVECISVTGISGSTVGTTYGEYGITGVGERGLRGAVKVPSWFRTTHGVGPYAVGFGGYNSRMAQGLGAHMGPTLYTIPDPLATSLSANYVFTTGYQKLMDPGSGANNETDWYYGTGLTSPNSYDRGSRIAGQKTNYFDKQASGVTGSYPSGPSAHWVTAPDGNDRWSWGDDFAQNCVWIDGATKHGYVGLLNAHLGNTYYSASYLRWSGGERTEWQIYDPDQFGEVVGGTRAGYNVKPASMWYDATIPDGDSVISSDGMTQKRVWGVAFDAIAKIFYIRRVFATGTWPNPRDRVYAYAVNI